MSTYTRPAKAVSGNGTTSVVDGNKWPASEINADFDGLVNLVNGNLDTANLSASANIANSQLVDIAMSKVLDLADDIATYRTTTTPGDTATPSLPTTLAAEMQRLRYRIGGNTGYSSNVYYMNSSGVATAAAWFEPKLVGPNLIPNPGFEVHSAGTPNAPDGWALVSTPATVAIENPAYTSVGLEKRSLNIVTNGANEGISATISGLKASAKYLIGMTYTLTDNGTVAGVLRLSTSGGLGSGNYQNLVLDTSTEAASTVATVQGIVKATSTPDPIVVSITATTAGGDFNLISVWMHELADGAPADLPSIPSQTGTNSTETDVLDAATGTWSTVSGLTLSQYIPAHGYRLHYECSISYSAKTEGTMPETFDSGVRIQMDIDSGGYNTVQGPFTFRNYSVTGDNQLQFSTRQYMHHIVESPVPGSLYTFHADVGVYDGGANAADLTLNPNYSTAGMGQSRSEAKLWLERK